MLSAISSGTGWGVALAALVVLAAGVDWRTAWLLFALIAAAATGWALVVLPGREAPRDPAGVVAVRLRWFLCPRSGPLLTGALLVGLASSVYWTFAVDHLVIDGGLSSTQSDRTPISGAVADHTGFAVVFAAAAALLLTTTTLSPHEALE